MSTTIREITATTWAVIRDGRERKRFTGRHRVTKYSAVRQAIDWALRRAGAMVYDVDRILFQTAPHGGQNVCHILDSGNCPEHGKPLAESLFKIEDTSGQGEVCLTGEEMDNLCKQWSAYRKQHRKTEILYAPGDNRAKS